MNSSYIHRHRIDRLKRLDRAGTQSDRSTAEFLHDHLDSMTEEEKKRLVTRVMSPELIERMLITAEFDEYRPETDESTLDESVERFRRLLHRYHWRAGGYEFDSSRWEIHRNETENYRVLAGEVWFVNTVPEAFVDRVKRYTRRLRDIASQLSSEVEVSLHRHSYRRDSLEVVVIKFRSSDAPSDPAEVGL